MCVLLQEVDIPADMVDKANEYREKMIDAIVEQDDAVSGPWDSQQLYLLQLRLHELI